MALTPEQTAQIQGALNPSIQFALPQTVVPITKTQRQVQSVQYDPEKMQNLIKALQAKRATPSKMDVFASILAEAPEARSYKGGFGEEIINPWASGFSALARGFGGAYTKRADAEREAENTAREDAIKAAQLEAEASKQTITEQAMQDYIKLNQSKEGDIDTSYRFAPEKIKELKDLNDKAGRWATEWGKGTSDMLNTEASKAYNEFEGRAKQYVQDQLKKIYGAQMTEAEGERFFKSMGLSPQLDPDLRWRLVENALDDLARKSGITIKQPTEQQPTEQQPININGFIIEEVK